MLTNIEEFMEMGTVEMGTVLISTFFNIKLQTGNNDYVVLLKNVYEIIKM